MSDGFDKVMPDSAPDDPDTQPANLAIESVEGAGTHSIQGAIRLGVLRAQAVELLADRAQETLAVDGGTVGFRALLDAALPHDSVSLSLLASYIRLPVESLEALRNGTESVGDLIPESMVRLAKSLGLDLAQTLHFVERDLRAVSTESALEFEKGLGIVQGDLEDAWSFLAAVDDGPGTSSNRI